MFQMVYNNTDTYIRHCKRFQTVHTNKYLLITWASTHANQYNYKNTFTLELSTYYYYHDVNWIFIAIERCDNNNIIMILYYVS